MDYRIVIFEGVAATYDYRIGLVGAYVVKFNGKFLEVHDDANGRPYIVNPTNNNKVFLIGNALRALNIARKMIGE